MARSPEESFRHARAGKLNVLVRRGCRVVKPYDKFSAIVFPRQLFG
jgi:hypothetical protein